jgi:hypothetical protein
MHNSLNGSVIQASQALGRRCTTHHWPPPSALPAAYTSPPRACQERHAWRRGPFPRCASLPCASSLLTCQKACSAMTPMQHRFGSQPRPASTHHQLLGIYYQVLHCQVAVLPWLHTTVLFSWSDRDMLAQQGDQACYVLPLCSTLCSCFQVCTYPCPAVLLP